MALPQESRNALGPGQYPSAVAGGVKTFEPQNPREYRTLNIDPPATAGGTDPVQVQVVTFEAKPLSIMRDEDWRQRAAYVDRRIAFLRELLAQPTQNCETA
jgi:hypothetical protein